MCGLHKGRALGRAHARHSLEELASVRRVDNCRFERCSKGPQRTPCPMSMTALATVRSLSSRLPPGQAYFDVAVNVLIKTVLR